MVSLQGLHVGDAFRHPTVSASVGLKSFCPWCLMMGRNTKIIAIHLSEVHYRMVIMCDIYRAFASLSTQNVLDHFSGCQQNTTRNVLSVKSLQKPLRKRSLEVKRRHLSCTVQMQPRSHKEQNATPHLLSSQASKCSKFTN